MTLHKKLTSVPLGAFELLMKLGDGASSEVYLANEIALDRQVAIKILKKEYTNDFKSCSRFYRERQALAKLNHPSIVQCYYEGETHGRLYTAIEYVNGNTCAKLIEHGPPLKLSEKLGIVCTVAEALNYVHACGLIHRDIKPHNIIISKHGIVKLIDFGFVKDLLGDDTVITHEGLGTPKYVAPEQALNPDSIDHRVDIYSLGITAYELISGQTPFQGNLTNQIIARDKGVFKPLSELMSGVPTRLDLLITRMIARSPSNRPSNATEVAEALRTVIQELTTSL